MSSLVRLLIVLSAVHLGVAFPAAKMEEAEFFRYFPLQFYSMSMDKDLFPGDADESVNRKNHEIAMAAMDLAGKLYTMNGAVSIILKNIKKTQTQVKSTGDQMGAMSFLCDSIEKSFKEEKSYLSGEFEKVRNIMKVKLGSGKFSKPVVMDPVPASSEEMKKRVDEWMKNPHAKIMFAKLSFYFKSLMWTALKKEDFVLTRSIVKVAKDDAGYGRQLQEIYGKSVSKASETLTISDKPENELQEVGSAILKEMEQEISKEPFLNTALQMAKKHVMESEEAEFFDHISFSDDLW